MLAGARPVRRRPAGARPPGRGRSTRPARSSRPSRPTSCCSPPAARRGCSTTAVPDGERILSWRDVYDLTELPEHLVVVGSGVTGAEFASGYSELGVPVTLVSSRDRVLPGEDPTPPRSSSRSSPAAAARWSSRPARPRSKRVGDGVVVELQDGRTVEGSHALMCVGSVPNTDRPRARARRRRARRAAATSPVDRVSRTVVPSIYAAGDCTGVLLLASVAGMQGRIAMWHALGEAVAPLRLKTVAANVFTHPEIATVGIGLRGDRVGQVPVADGDAAARDATRAPRCRASARDSSSSTAVRRPAWSSAAWSSRPAASELIFPLTLAVQRGPHRRRPGRNNRGLPVVVRVGRRGRPTADAARRPGLTSDASKRRS